MDECVCAHMCPRGVCTHFFGWTLNDKVFWSLIGRKSRHHLHVFVTLFCLLFHYTPAPKMPSTEAASPPRLACFTLQTQQIALKLSTPRLTCEEPDTQTVSKSIKLQHWWQIEVTLNYEWCSEVITHRALAKMLWRSSLAISAPWTAALDPSLSPR